MRTKRLLGISENNDILFGNFEVRERDGKKIFSASFSAITPFEVEPSDGIDYFEDILENCYDNADKYELCEKFDCAPSQLAEEMARDAGICTNADERDCSIYMKRIYVDGIEYAFESSSCGQHDIRKDGVKEYTNKKAVEKLLNLWDLYHLKEVSDEITEEVEELAKTLDTDIEEKISEYISKYILEV